MLFEWDDSKAATNEKKHGIPFPYAARVFLDAKHVVVTDNKRDYGEPRFIALGKVEKRLLVVIFTLRNGTYRLISARKGNAREQKKYNAFRARS